MVSLELLYQELEQRDVRLVVYPVGEQKGATIELNGKYAIFLDGFLVKSTSELMHILAHELGHCATGATHAVSSPFDLVARHETKADRWAFQRCLPFEHLARAMQDGCHEVWQLAEYFNFPEEFIREAIEYYVGACGKTFPDKEE